MHPIKKNLYFKKKNKNYIKCIRLNMVKVNCICYIFNNKLAYISDVSKIDKKDFKILKI